MFFVFLYLSRLIFCFYFVLQNKILDFRFVSARWQCVVGFFCILLEKLLYVSYIYTKNIFFIYNNGVKNEYF